MDPLYDFACDFLERHPISPGMAAYGPIPEHTHPNVDSFEAYIDGQIKLSHQGKIVFECADTVFGSDPTSYKWRLLRVKPEDRHGSIAGPKGARFMSIQHWLNGMQPSCVGSDYTGLVLDQDHLPQITSGQPIARRQADLTEREIF
jgi:hypothetical protein